jgi:hypothetical protein
MVLSDVQMCGILITNITIYERVSVSKRKKKEKEKEKEKSV